MVQIWTDASFNNYTKNAGLGILIRELIPGGVKETKISLKTKAEDNNVAELQAIYYALQNIKGLRKDEPIFIITDSKIAIDCIKNPEGKCEKFRGLAECIRGMLYCEKWRIYHKKAHTKNKDRYSVRQELVDKIAKNARQY